MEINVTSAVCRFGAGDPVIELVNDSGEVITLRMKLIAVRKLGGAARTCVAAMTGDYNDVFPAMMQPKDMGA